MQRIRFSAGFIVFLAALGIYEPFVAVSVILVVLTERFALRNIPALHAWPGLELA